MDSGTDLPVNERNPVREPGLLRQQLERLLEISRSLSASPRAPSRPVPYEIRDDIRDSG